MGDKTVVAQTVQLLAYIRHAIRNNLSTKIQVDLPNTAANVPFMMDVNGMEIPDLVTVERMQINWTQSKGNRQMGTTSNFLKLRSTGTPKLGECKSKK